MTDAAWPNTVFIYATGLPGSFRIVGALGPFGAPGYAVTTLHEGPLPLLHDDLLRRGYAREGPPLGPWRSVGSETWARPTEPTP